MVHFRGGRAGIDIHAYPDLEEFFTDLSAVYRAEIDA
jgi:5-methyltetrahydropteroyltriglutamate--homocysteine methyltransferase